ncbi:MAG TPA: RagB/SusD family nutrient uptake outer membrane protein [Longimicrobiales bacterium]|nr:RagB/SusD family nutrient uptake outer membrane protein [Longimicrobiales bacterium]
MRIRSALLLGFAVVTTTACEDILTEEPEAFITSDTYYTTVAQLDAAAVAMYSLFHDWNMFKIQYHWTFELAADQGRFHPDEPNVETQAPEYLNWTSTSRDAIQPWKTLYWNILRAHQVLDNLDNVEFPDPAVRTRLEAEGRFMRAFHYFWLARAYGDVPLYLSEAEQIQVDQARTPEEQVIDQVIADAEFAAAGLPNTRSGAELGRATRGAALMLLADAYRWKANVISSDPADWQASLDAAEAVIESGVYSLHADYAEIHEPGSQFRGEEIFAVQSIGGGGWWQSSVFGAVYWPRDLGEGNGGGWAVVIPTAEFYDSYPDGDYRREATFWTSGCAASEPEDCDEPTAFSPTEAAYGFPDGYPHVHKYVPSDRGLLFYGGGDVNIPLYRFAEAHLFVAEAANELGNQARAAQALNVLRARARQGTGSETRAAPADVGALGQAEMRDLIYRERAWELSYELKRWFDMVQRGEQYFISQMQQNDPLALELGNVVGTRMRLPIPAGEIQRNPALTQNPGY